MKGWDCTEILDNGTTFCFEICGDGYVVAVGVEDCDDGVPDQNGCKDNCVGVRKGWRCSKGRERLSVCYPICGDGFSVLPNECDDGDPFD